MKNKLITGVAFFETFYWIVGTLIVLYIKIYNLYNIGWIYILFPTATLIAFNILLIIISIFMLVLGAFNSKNYIKDEKRE